jgi:hypothetical protein
MECRHALADDFAADRNYDLHSVPADKLAGNSAVVPGMDAQIAEIQRIFYFGHFAHGSAGFRQIIIFCFLFARFPRVLRHGFRHSTSSHPVFRFVIFSYF